MAQPPKALEVYWYQRLEAEGFQDIEDTKSPDRPLKRWDSFEFTRERNHERRQRQGEYQTRLEQFAPQIPEIARILVAPGREGHQPELTAQQVRRIIEMHKEGMTERQIAVELRRSKGCIHKVLAKVKEWIRLA